MNYKINYIKINIQKFNLTQVLLIILILFLVYIHFIKKVPILEGMSGAINPEALANLSAMYNNGKLKVSSLEVTGDTNLKGKATITGNAKITGNLDTDGYGRFGPAKIGQWVGGKDYAVFGHKDRFGVNTDYPFMNHKDGETYVNSSKDKKVHLRNGGVHSLLTENGKVNIPTLNINGKKPVLKGEVINITMRGTKNHKHDNNSYKDYTIGIANRGISIYNDDNMKDVHNRGDFRIIDSIHPNP